MLIYGKGSLFRCPLKRGFSFATPSAPQLFFSCCPLFRGVTRTPAQGRWITGVFPHSLGWLWRTEPLPQACLAAESSSEDGVGSMKTIYWSCFFFSHTSPNRCSTLKKLLWAQPNARVLLSETSPSSLFPFISTGDRHFSPIIKVFSSYTHHKFQSPLSSSAFHSFLFYCKKRKGGSADIPIIYM